MKRAVNTPYSSRRCAPNVDQQILLAIRRAQGEVRIVCLGVNGYVVEPSVFAAIKVAARGKTVRFFVGCHSAAPVTKTAESATLPWLSLSGQESVLEVDIDVLIQLSSGEQMNRQQMDGQQMDGHGRGLAGDSYSLLE